MKIFLTLLLFMLILISCKKDVGSNGDCTNNCLTFNGRLIEKQSGNGLEGVPIKLFYDYPSALFGNKANDYLGTTTTLSDGTYSFSLARSSTYNTGGKIILTGEKEGYIDGAADWLTAWNVSSTTDSVFTRELELWKSAPLNIRVRTVTTSNFDQFYFNHFFGNVSFIDPEPIRKNRQPFDITFRLLTAADIPTRINWTTSNLNGSGSVILSGSDTIVVASGTTGNLLIEL